MLLTTKPGSLLWLVDVLALVLIWWCVDGILFGSSRGDSYIDGRRSSMVHSLYDLGRQEGTPKDCQVIDIRQLRVVFVEGLDVTIRTEIKVEGAHDRALVKLLVSDFYAVMLGVKPLESGVEKDIVLEFPSKKNFYNQDWELFAHFYVYDGDTSHECVESIEVRL